jgi:Serine dehydrogenase proteinase
MEYKPNITMEDLLNLIRELGKIRKIPQFLYFSGINFPASIKLKEIIVNFKRGLSESESIDEIDFILISPGGSPDDAYRIIRTLRKNFKTVNVVIPFWAKSAATLLSLGASCIIMDEFAEFGPLDIQLIKERDDNLFIDPDDRESALIDQISLETIEKRAHSMFLNMFVSIHTNPYIPINKNDLANDLLTYLSKFYEPLLSQINPYKVGDKRRKNDIGTKYATRIINKYHPHIPNQQVNAFVDFLVNECPDHGYIVDYDLLKKQLPDIPLFDSKQLDVTFAGYSEKLTDITLYLLGADHETETFIDFVSEQKEETDVQDNSEPDQQLNTIEPINHKENGKSKKASAVK